MNRQLRRRYWFEAAAAIASAVLFLLTLLWRDWIEITLRMDPDNGSGALEWLIVAASLILTLACSVLARHEWRRAVAAAG